MPNSEQSVYERCGIEKGDTEALIARIMQEYEQLSEEDKWRVYDFLAAAWQARQREVSRGT